MRKAANWIVLAVVVTVALSPLCEIFDKTDQWSEDGADFVLYIICLFCLLAFSIRRGALVIVARLVWPRNSILTTVLPPLIDRNVDQVCPGQRGLFLTFCDLRI
ncbi:MAG TPA: hypothetical protein VER98_09840 [Terriglobia bacterium]|nr:hypothetical protein [Terriglobia bacterium]